MHPWTFIAPLEHARMLLQLGGAMVGIMLLRTYTGRNVFQATNDKAGLSCSGKVPWGLKAHPCEPVNKAPKACRALSG